MTDYSHTRHVVLRSSCERVVMGNVVTKCLRVISAPVKNIMLCDDTLSSTWRLILAKHVTYGLYLTHL